MEKTTSCVVYIAPCGAGKSNAIIAAALALSQKCPVTIAVPTTALVKQFVDAFTPLNVRPRVVVGMGGTCKNDTNLLALQLNQYSQENCKACSIREECLYWYSISTAPPETGITITTHAKLLWDSERQGEVIDGVVIYDETPKLFYVKQDNIPPPPALSRFTHKGMDVIVPRYPRGELGTFIFTATPMHIDVLFGEYDVRHPYQGIAPRGAPLLQTSLDLIVRQRWCAWRVGNKKWSAWGAAPSKQRNDPNAPYFGMVGLNKWRGQRLSVTGSYRYPPIVAEVVARIYTDVKGCEHYVDLLPILIPAITNTHAGWQKRYVPAAAWGVRNGKPVVVEPSLPDIVQLIGRAGAIHHFTFDDEGVKVVKRNAEADYYGDVPLNIIAPDDYKQFSLPTSQYFLEIDEENVYKMVAQHLVAKYQTANSWLVHAGQRHVAALLGKCNHDKLFLEIKMQEG